MISQEKVTKLLEKLKETHVPTINLDIYFLENVVSILLEKLKYNDKIVIICFSDGSFFYRIIPYINDKPFAIFEFIKKYYHKYSSACPEYKFELELYRYIINQIKNKVLLYYIYKNRSRLEFSNVLTYRHFNIRRFESAQLVYGDLSICELWKKYSFTNDNSIIVVFEIENIYEKIRKSSEILVECLEGKLDPCIERRDLEEEAEYDEYIEEFEE